MRIAQRIQQNANLVQREFTPGLAGACVELRHHCIQLIDGRGIRHGKFSIEERGIGNRELLNLTKSHDGRKQSGRSLRTRVNDLWIAAQAMENDYDLLTANLKDFEGLPGLRVSCP